MLLDQVAQEVEEEDCCEFKTSLLHKVTKTKNKKQKKQNKRLGRWASQ